MFAKVKAIFVNKSFVQQTTDGAQDTYGILLDKTNFYAESGGQEYDIGSITVEGAAEFEVTNVQAFGGYVLHIGSMKYGTLTVGQDVTAMYEEVRAPFHFGHHC